MKKVKLAIAKSDYVNEVIVGRQHYAQWGYTADVSEDGTEQDTGTCYRAVMRDGETAIEAVRRIVKEDIEEYDASDAVNSFNIKSGEVNISYWLAQAKRGGLKVAAEAVIAQGSTTYTLDIREQNISLDVPAEALLQMLSQLEVYTVKSYNTTSKHLAAVSALQTIDELAAYDYTADYPEIPTFDMTVE